MADVPPNPVWRSGRGRRALRPTLAGIIATLGFAGLGVASSPTVVAGASQPASLDCGTLEVSGTNGNSYQFDQFTPDRAVGGNAQDDGGTWTPTTYGSGGGPFNLSSIGSAVSACSDNFGPNDTTTTGTVSPVGPGDSTLALYGTGNVNVFTVTTDQLAMVPRIDFSVPAESTTLVDVIPSADFGGALNLSALSGDIYFGCPTAAPNPANNSMWDNGDCGSQPAANENTSAIDVERDNTVWNFSPRLFPTRDSLTVGGWQGTIVAPNETVTFDGNGSYDGGIFCHRIYGMCHPCHDPFHGRVPRCPHGLPPALPEGNMVDMGGFALAAFAGFVLYGHRRTAGAGMQDS
jgi:choice-of-anchor A domain-containing protein